MILSTKNSPALRAATSVGLRPAVGSFGQVGGMSVYDVVSQKVLNGIFVSEDAHDNVRAGLRLLHLKAAVVRRPIKEIGINRKYVGERSCLPHVMGVTCQLIVPSHLYESMLGFG